MGKENHQVQKIFSNFHWLSTWRFSLARWLHRRKHSMKIVYKNLCHTMRNIWNITVDKLSNDLYKFHKIVHLYFFVKSPFVATFLLWHHAGLFFQYFSFRVRLLVHSEFYLHLFKVKSTFFDAKYKTNQ